MKFTLLLGYEPRILAFLARELLWCGYSFAFAVSHHFRPPSRCHHSNRIKIAYFDQTPKHLALLEALVPVDFLHLPASHDLGGSLCSEIIAKENLDAHAVMAVALGTYGKEVA